MGYAVLHLEKAKGTDSRMSAHIERTVHPKNADRTRTHLNRELVQFPEGVRNRTQAIAHRVETAGIRRKVVPIR
ncbi:putative mobilization protein [Bacteroides fragilis str. J-143-4]|nr:putative mobilization protein [Bacteroides fragilis str. J-143-4]